ncbi:MAG: lipase [Stenotrophomonas acidaminiphila]|nr:MAG: lipase [Stenotrophomonas acidaminiphila]
MPRCLVGVSSLLGDGVQFIWRQCPAGWLYVAPATVGDIVHLNCGLHDIRYNPGLTFPVSSLAQYRANLVGIFEMLARTQCQVIWATSTPLDEARHNASKPSRRYLADLLRYNEASVELAHAFGFAVNDLYQVANAAGLSELLLPDGIHFNPQGNRVVGQAIAEAIGAHL